MTTDELKGQGCQPCRCPWNRLPRPAARQKAAGDIESGNPECIRPMKAQGRYSQMVSEDGPRLPRCRRGVQLRQDVPEEVLITACRLAFMSGPFSFQVNARMQKLTSSPKILVFSTEKISDPGIDQAGLRKIHYSPSVYVISVPCSRYRRSG